MKHKTAELEGALLDAAVAKAEGLTFRFERSGALFVEGVFAERSGPDYAPSSCWEDGGPIIEREHIRLDWDSRFGWFAYPGIDMPIDCLPTMDPSSSPLIAAMRAYVASKFGEEVEL